MAAVSDAKVAVMDVQADVAVDAKVVAAKDAKVVAAEDVLEAV